MSTLSPDNATVVQPSPFETLQDLQSLVETRDTTYNNPNDIGDGRQTGSEPEGPRHHALLPPDFLWGEKTGEVFSQLVSSAYEEVVHWRHNIFLIPSGRAGKTFVRELARLYQAYADASTLECIALKGRYRFTMPAASKATCKEQIQRSFHPSRTKVEIVARW